MHSRAAEVIRSQRNSSTVSKWSLKIIKKKEITPDKNSQLVRGTQHYSATENGKDFTRQVTKFGCKNWQRQLQRGNSRAATVVIQP